MGVAYFRWPAWVQVMALVGNSWVSLTGQPLPPPQEPPAISAQASTTTDAALHALDTHRVFKVSSDALRKMAGIDRDDRQNRLSYITPDGTLFVSQDTTFAKAQALFSRLWPLLPPTVRAELVKAAGDLLDPPTDETRLPSPAEVLFQSRITVWTEMSQSRIDEAGGVTAVVFLADALALDVTPRQERKVDPAIQSAVNSLRQESAFRQISDGLRDAVKRVHLEVQGNPPQPQKVGQNRPTSRFLEAA